jgi:ribosomal protein S21
MEVKVRNGNVNKALSIFKKKCMERLFEYREREFYEPPSATKQKAIAAARKREKKRQSEN